MQLKIQINSKRPGFGRGKPVEDKFTLGPTAQASLVIVEEMYGDTNNFIHELLIKMQNLS